MSYLVVLLSVFALGCATSSPQTRHILKAPPPVPLAAEVKAISYIEQDDGDCGPAALAALMSGLGDAVNLQELRSEVYTPSKKGSLPLDLVSAARRRGFLAIQISGLSALLQEVASGHPVIVFQNLGFSWAPKWHYAVVTGYDLQTQKMTVLAKEKSQAQMPMTYFERYWQLADYWGLLVLRPTEMSVTADELAHMRAATGLEQAGKLTEAEVAYQKILGRWPQSLSALIGSGNVAYKKKDYATAVRILKKAVQWHPDSTAAQHNLAVATAALKKLK